MTGGALINYAAIGLAAMLLAGCRIERADSQAGADKIAYDADRAANALIAGRFYPAVDARAVPLAAAGGAPNPRVVRFEGQVLSVDGSAQSRIVAVDVDTDGRTDVLVQLGPVIRGTALRDAIGLVAFTDFDSQIDYARFARSLNTRVVARATATLPPALVGRRISVVGAVAGGGEQPRVTPVRITLQGPA